MRGRKGKKRSEVLFLWRREGRCTDSCSPKFDLFDTKELYVITTKRKGELYDNNLERNRPLSRTRLIRSSLFFFQSIQHTRWCIISSHYTSFLLSVSLLVTLTREKGMTNPWELRLALSLTFSIHP